VNSDGSYSLPEGVDKSWFNQLKKASDLNGITGDKQPDVGNREYKLIDLGYGKIWLWVEKGKTTATSEDIAVSLAYNEWLSRMIAKHGLGFVQGDCGKGMDELFYEQNARLIKELSTGIDSVTGKKLTTAEKLGKASLLANGLITMGVMVKGVVKVSTPKNSPSNKNTVIQGSKNGKNYTLDKNKSNGNKSYKKASGVKVPTLNSLSDEIASSLGGKASPLKNGYKVEIPNGRKPIVVRIMDEGSGGRGKPYYRVSIDGKGSLTPEGIISSDRGLTHIDLSENSMSEITNIINNYLGRK
jgi:hypothetical protein